MEKERKPTAEQKFKILREEADKGKLDNGIVEHLIEMVDSMANMTAERQDIADKQEKGH